MSRKELSDLLDQHGPAEIRKAAAKVGLAVSGAQKDDDIATIVNWATTEKRVAEIVAALGPQ